MKVIVQGLATEYSDEGSGPVILMLHGWKDTLHTFDAIASELRGTYRVVRLDMPGFGESDMPDPQWRLDDYVDFVEAFVAKLSLDIEVLVGHSFGGRVIIKGAHRWVFSPRRIVLIAAAGVSDRKKGRNTTLKMIAKTGKLLTAPLPRGIRGTLRHALYASVGSDYHATGRLKDIFLNVVGEDLSHAAPSISVPTLLIWGSADTSTPLAEGMKLDKLIPNSRLEVIEGGTHFVHHEHPRKIAQLMRTFL